MVEGEEKEGCVLDGRFGMKQAKKQAVGGRNQQREPNFVLVAWVL